MFILIWKIHNTEPSGLKKLDKLPILAIETAGNACSVALMMSEEYIIEYSIKLRHVQSEKLVSLVDQVLNEADMKANKLASVAVSVGPGSFTGLRIGVSVAKGIAFGVNIPVCPVPTFDALAFQIASFLPDTTNFYIANKVNRDELYLAGYKKEEEKVTEFNKLQTIYTEDLEKTVGQDSLIFGDFKQGNLNLSTPSAEKVAVWSYFFGKDLLTFELDYLEPFYLKNFIPKVKK